VNAGTLDMQSPFTQAGTIQVASGATFRRSGGFTNSATGVLAGGGTIDLVGATLTNDGAVRPGGAGTIGTLSIAGNFVQGSGGSLDVDLASGPSYDVLAVSGAATLDGTLNVNYLGGYTGAGNVHPVLAYASATGTFATINDVNSLPANYGATQFTLGLLSGFNIWTGGAGDFLWSSAGNWSFGHAPTAGEDAQVPDLALSPTISLAAGAQTPRSFVFLGDETFSLTGGSLSFANPSSLANGTLSIAGGALIANAALTAKNLSLSNGSLAGPGSLNVTDSFSGTGGSINLGGPVSLMQAAGNLAIGIPVSAGALTLGAASGDVVITDATASSAGLTSVTGRDLKVLSVSAPAQLAGGSMNINVTRDVIATASGAGEATIVAYTGTQTVLAGRDITLQAGGAGALNDASILSFGGLQTVVAAGTVGLWGGAGGDDNISSIESHGGQMITAGAIQLQGGSGVGPNGNRAEILQMDVGAAQTLVVTGGGTLSLQGGTGTNNVAIIHNEGTAQTISFPGGGTLQLTGGSGGPANSAQIRSESGTQTIQGSAGITDAPAILLQGGGAGGMPDDGNDASIEGDTAAQNIYAANLTLQAGTGLEANATITTDVSPVNIAVSGMTSLMGGTGTDALAAIGSDASAVDITINSAGGLSLQGGTGATSNFGAFALIGALGGNNANVTITSAGGAISLARGASGGMGDAMIGSQLGGGTVRLTGTAIALADGKVGTTGGLALTSTVGATTGSTYANTLAVSGAGGVNVSNTAPSGSTILGTAGSTSGVTSTNAAISVAETAGSLVIAQPVNAGTGTVVITTAGSISLNNSITANTAGGDAIVLSGSGFAAGGGAALNPGAGRWLVYSGDPGAPGESRGGLAFDFKRYNCTYAGGCLTAGTSIPAAGNGFLYSIAPTLGVSANPVGLAYGDAPAALTYVAGGFIDGDTAASALAGALSRTGGGMSGSGNEVIGTYAIDQGTLVSPLGYQVLYTGANYVIGQRALAGAAIAPASSTYGAALAPGAVSFGNLLPGDAVSSAVSVNTGALSSSGNPVAGSYTQTASATLSGADAGNYSFAGGFTTPAANYTIGKQTLALAGSSGVDRTYDGTATMPTGNPGHGAPTGIVPGDSVAVTGAAIYDGKNAGSRLVQQGTLALGGADAGNYQLGWTDGSGTIAAAPLTIGAVTDTRAFDGTTASAGIPVVSSGTLFAGDSLTASQAFADRNVLGANGSTLNVNAGYALNDGNGGNNYAVTLQPATGTITQQPLTVRPADITLEVGSAIPASANLLVVSGAVGAGDQLAPVAVTTTATSASPAGTYPLTPGTISFDVGTTANYAITAQDGSLVLVVPQSGAAGAAEQSNALAAAVNAAVTTSTAPIAPGVAVPPDAGSPGSAAPLVTIATTRAVTPSRANPLMLPVIADMLEMRKVKRQTLGKATVLLEQNPEMADLPPCAGAVSGSCIASRGPDGPAPGDAAAPPAPALAHLPSIERKVALLIGVSDYEDPIPSLASPVKDLEEIGRIYRELLGYEVRMLPNADKAAIVLALNRLILETGANDSVTVVYAGHGHMVEKTQRGYWIPARASAEDPSQWISNNDIARILEGIAARQILLVSDSCYSGTLAREAKVDKAQVPADYRQVLAQRSVTVLSSGGEEPVPDQGRDGHSVFAWHFMQQLKGVKDVARGVDLSGQVAQGVAAEIPQVPQYGAGLGSGHQRGGDYLFEVRRYK